MEIPKIDHNSLQEFYCDNHPIEYVDNIPINWFPDSEFNLKFYNTIKRVQRRQRIRFRLKNKAAQIIQDGCHNWIWKPILRDGKYGIRPRLDMEALKSIISMTQV